MTPTDPFASADPLNDLLNNGSLLFRQLIAQDTKDDTIRAIETLDLDDLRAIVLERIFSDRSSRDDWNWQSRAGWL